MTLAHFIYIPGVFLLGTVAGFILGGRAAAAAAADRDAADQRSAARRARAAARAEAPTAPREP